MSHGCVYQLITESELNKGTEIIESLYFEAPGEISRCCDYYNDVDFMSEGYIEDIQGFAHTFGFTLEKEFVKLSPEQSMELYYFVPSNELFSRLEELINNVIINVHGRAEKAKALLSSGEGVIAKIAALAQISLYSWEDTGSRFYQMSEGCVQSEYSLATIIAPELGRKIYIGGVIDYHY